MPRVAGYKKTSAELPGAVQMSFRSIAHGNFLSVSDTQKAPRTFMEIPKGISIKDYQGSSVMWLLGFIWASFGHAMSFYMMTSASWIFLWVIDMVYEL